jgi:hypothetical protein
MQQSPAAFLLSDWLASRSMDWLLRSRQAMLNSPTAYVGRCYFHYVHFPTVAVSIVMLYLFSRMSSRGEVMRQRGYKPDWFLLPRWLRLHQKFYLDDEVAQR